MTAVELENEAWVGHGEKQSKGTNGQPDVPEQVIYGR